MSAINFSADVQKKTTEAGERVIITFNGKVCPAPLASAGLYGETDTLCLFNSGCPTPGLLKVACSSIRAGLCIM